MNEKLHEIEDFRDKHHMFRDRTHGGEILADMLAPKYQDRPDSLILAIPSGGVPIGLALSEKLNLPLDMIIVRKLQIPGNTEAGFGALSLGGRAHLNEELLSRLRLDAEQIDREVRKVEEELAVRNRLFRQDRPQPDVRGKTILIADDGLASGFTMLSAAITLSEQGAKRIIAAVPTAPMSSIKKVAPYLDEIYSAHVQSYGPYAVANAYQRWYDLTREEVMESLRGKVHAG
jgi:predicted phosphoribosyltransferase